MSFSRKARLERRIDKHGGQLRRALDAIAAAGESGADGRKPTRAMVDAALALRRDLPTGIVQSAALEKMAHAGEDILEAFGRDPDVVKSASERLIAAYQDFEAGGKR